MFTNFIIGLIILIIFLLVFYIPHLMIPILAIGTIISLVIIIDKIFK